MLATDWEYIDDTHVQFKPRDDVTSHDGYPFTASDVIYTITTGQDSGLLSNYYGMFDLSECSVVDDYTVILATKSADPFFLSTLSNTTLAMVIEASVEANGCRALQGLKATAGTGPDTFCL